MKVYDDGHVRAKRTASSFSGVCTFPGCRWRISGPLRSASTVQSNITYHNTRHPSPTEEQP